MKMFNITFLFFIFLSAVNFSSTATAAISKELTFNAQIKNIETSNVEVIQNGRVFRVPKSIIKQPDLKVGQNLSLKLTTAEFRKIKEVALKTQVAHIPTTQKPN